MIFRATNSISSYCPFKSFKLGQPWTSGKRRVTTRKRFPKLNGSWQWIQSPTPSSWNMCSGPDMCRLIWVKVTRTYSNCLNWHPNKQDKSFDVIHTMSYHCLRWSSFNVCHQKFHMMFPSFVCPGIPVVTQPTNPFGPDGHSWWIGIPAPTNHRFKGTCYAAVCAAAPLSRNRDSTCMQVSLTRDAFSQLVHEESIIPVGAKRESFRNLKLSWNTHHIVRRQGRWWQPKLATDPSTWMHERTCMQVSLTRDAFSQLVHEESIIPVGAKRESFRNLKLSWNTHHIVFQPPN